MNYRIITPPAQLPVDIQTARDQLRVDHTNEDDLIIGLVAAATNYFEDVYSHSLITQTLELVLESWPVGSRIIMPQPPLQSITSIKYYDQDGVEYTLDSSSYLVNTTAWPGFVILKSGSSWPTVDLKETEGILIRFVAGYGEDFNHIPQAIHQGLLMLLGHLYENRETVVIDRGITIAQVPWGTQILWAPHKNWKG